MRPRLSSWFVRHWRRIAVTLLPLLFALLHVSGVLHLQVLERLESIIYDTRLRATMPGTMDTRITIVDIDERSLERIGQWPWGRDKMARFATELLDRQQVAVLGFDVVFAEPDGSSGLASLQRLAQGPLAASPGFSEQLARLTPELDYDARFAQALQGRPVVLGYYFTSDRDGQARGVLPAPALPRDRLRGKPLRATSWQGHGSNIEVLAKAAPAAGFFNSITDSDGVVRSLPLLAEHQGQYYESLALAMLRVATGYSDLSPLYDAFSEFDHDVLSGVILAKGQSRLLLPVDPNLATLIPYRGPGDVSGGSYRYISASDVLEGRLAEASLKGQLVLVGSTAPGLVDLRVTPVGRTYPGVEAHANLLSAFLDGANVLQPNFAPDFDVLQLVVTGLLLALSLPLLTAGWAVLLSAGVLAGLVGLNLWLYQVQGLVMPLATVLVMALSAFTLNMVYGYFVESRTKRELAALFGTYVPPELVEEMLKEPERYSMDAANQELTVMFCDMRGFTALSEHMEPLQLQAMLNGVFSRLTHIIRSRRQGTIDKYMGDCVMAFWGAPVATPEHAELAVAAALEMTQAVALLNEEHHRQGLPQIGVGIGLNTGTMCVGDMGSDIRRSYTVIGDAVNLGSRLEGLSKTYGVTMVVSDTTRALAPGFIWQELDRVRVKGKAQAVTIYTPVGTEAEPLAPERQQRLATWEQLLAAYRAQEWDACTLLLRNLHAAEPGNVLYSLYAGRVEALRVLPFQPDWDGATQFDTK